MHCNLKPPDAEPVIFLFNRDARVKFEDGQPISLAVYSVLLLMPHFTV